MTPRELATWHLRQVIWLFGELRWTKDPRKLEEHLTCAPDWGRKLVRDFDRLALHWEARKTVERLIVGAP